MPSDFTWVETPNDPADPLPDGRLTPLRFQADRDLDYIMVDAGAQAEECAYRAGAFRGPYAAHSSIDGSRNVVLFREDGWPVPPKVIPRVQSAGGPVPQLQPLNGALAAWALAAGNGGSQVDRSGGGLDMGAGYYSFGANIPSPVAGQVAPYTTGVTSQAAFSYQASVDPTPLIASGFTFCFWLLRTTTELLTGSAYPEGWPLLWFNGSALFLPFGFRIATGIVVATSVAGGVVSSLAVPLGRWSFCSVAVDAAGLAEFGVDGAYETVAGVAPNGGAPGNTPLRLFGFIPGSTAFGRFWAGALSDVGLWVGKKSQAFCENQRLKAKTGS